MILIPFALGSTFLLPWGSRAHARLAECRPYGTWDFDHASPGLTPGATFCRRFAAWILTGVSGLGSKLTARSLKLKALRFSTVVHRRAEGSTGCTQ